MPDGMSLLRHIRCLNAHNPRCFAPLYLAGQRTGWVTAPVAAVLEKLPGFVRRAGAMILTPGDGEGRSAALDEAVEALIAAHLCPPRRGEIYAVLPAWGRRPVALVDRAACPAFGFHAFGVHIHGLVEQGGDLAMWIARRGLTRGVAPGRLDNMVAGGLPHGLSPLDNVIKEAGEEAGVAPDLARRARPVGAVSYAFDLAPLDEQGVPAGLRRDMLFVYELSLPDQFVPEPQDDEVIAFELWPAVEAIARAAATDDFKFNVPLTLIDFALRHGLIDPGDGEYRALLAGLRLPA
jgi:8-oxo-dGTP pyrophosphatase MutT (NUDIX family)